MTFLIESEQFLSPCFRDEKAWGGVAEDNRRFVNAVTWNLRTGSPSRDLPPDYEDWKNTHRRFCRWRDNGHWEKPLTELIKEPDFEWLMIDASHVKAHCHAAGDVGGSEAIGLTKGGATPRCIWPWMRMVCRCESLLQRVPWRIAQRLARLLSLLPFNSPAPSFGSTSRDDAV